MSETRVYHASGGTACKACRKARNLEWRRDNPEKLGQMQRRNDLKRKYGITPASVGDACEICGTTDFGWRAGKPLRASVDHDHATGAVRGTLCNRCNRAIGLFKDDPAILRQAVAYLEARNGNDS